MTACAGVPVHHRRLRPRFFLLAPLLVSASFGATAITVEDQTISGELIGLDAGPIAVLRVGGKVRRIPCADLLAIELRSGNASPRTGDSAVVLRDGRVLRGAIVGGGSRAVALRSPLFTALECPLAAITRIEFPVAQPTQPPKPARKHDRLLFANNDLVDGTVLAFGPKGIRFRSELLGELDVGFDRLKTLVFAAQDGGKPPTPKGVTALVRADDGSIVAGTIRSLTEGRLELQAAGVTIPNGVPLSLALDHVLRIEFRGGRLVFLSDLEPAEVKETPFFDLVWHYRRDRSVDGNPLRLGDRTYRKGLGVHSRCELTYALEGSYRRFLADFGLDEEVGDKGNVDVAVLVDGKPRFERKGLTGRDAPLAIAVDLTGASRLTLRVDFGRDFDICDHADWANARLIR